MITAVMAALVSAGFAFGAGSDWRRQPQMIRTPHMPLLCVRPQPVEFVPVVVSLDGEHDEVLRLLQQLWIWTDMRESDHPSKVNAVHEAGRFLDRVEPQAQVDNHGGHS
jgi:hypothetical protein